MKKLLLVIPIIFGTLCTTQSFAEECAQGDKKCETTRDNTTTKKCTQNSDCNDMFGAKKAICKPYGGEHRCTARECNEGFYLWFHNGSSMGICYTQKMAENYCKNPEYCTEKDCEPKFESQQNPEGKTVAAFTSCIKKKSTDGGSGNSGGGNGNSGGGNGGSNDGNGGSGGNGDSGGNGGSNGGSGGDGNNNDSDITVTINCTPGDQSCQTTDIFTQIDSFIGNKFSEKSSVWKNDEGKFNTARLASDSIAGVVLGTVGGVITSNIIKKNQIENGFENLKCTIGGQTVASYGDEFTVGVK